MKWFIFLAIGSVLGTGCVHHEVESGGSGEVIVDPSGAAVTNDWSHQPRDINQRPYGQQFERDENRTIDLE